MTKGNEILDILENKYLYKNTSNKGIIAYVDTTANGLQEMSIESKSFRNIVMWDYYRTSGKTISPKTVEHNIAQYMGTILSDMKKVKVSSRIDMAKNGSAIRIDIGDKDYHYIEVTRDGWNILDGGQDYFSHLGMQSEMPMPSRDGDIRKLLDYCRIPEDMWTVFIAYIVSCFLDIIHPCLVIQGAAGSSKSTLSTIIKMIVDPCKNNKPIIFPDNAMGLKDVFTQMYMASFDNMGKLNQKQSNFLCSIITGASIVQRKLYTNSESVEYDLKQPIILNGLSDIISRQDLMDRCIVITLPTMDEQKRKSEREIFRDFEKDLPDILGGIMDILVDTLKNYKPETVNNPPRMIDFFEYGFYICDTFGYGKRFITDYKRMLDAQSAEFKPSNTLVETFECFREQYQLDVWEGSATKLSEELGDMFDDIGTEPSIPLTPNWLSRCINNSIELLDENGIEISRRHDSRNCSYIKITFDNW